MYKTISNKLQNLEQPFVRQDSDIKSGSCVSQQLSTKCGPAAPFLAPPVHSSKCLWADTEPQVVPGGSGQHFLWVCECVCMNG